RSRRKIPDGVLAALSHQCEDRALWVRALQDPSVAQDFDWPVDDSPAAGLHPPYCFVDVVDIEVIEPERHRLGCGLGEHAADDLPTRGEQLVGAPGVGIEARLLPAEHLAVKRERSFPIGGE